MTLLPLDDVDLAILRILQTDSTISHKAMGIQLNRSASVIYERIRKLEKQAYITGYKATVDYQKVSNLFISYTFVKINAHSNEAFSKFETEICAFKEVLECTHITGNFDFLLKVVVNNMRNYNYFVRSGVGNLENVGKVFTSTVISEKKRIIEYPID